jgi:hypothetical protein
VFGAGFRGDLQVAKEGIMGYRPTEREREALKQVADMIGIDVGWLHQQIERRIGYELDNERIAREALIRAREARSRAFRIALARLA